VRRVRFRGRRGGRGRVREPIKYRYTPGGGRERFRWKGGKQRRVSVSWTADADQGQLDGDGSLGAVRLRRIRKKGASRASRLVRGVRPEGPEGRKGDGRVGGGAVTHRITIRSKVKRKRTRQQE